MSTSTLSSEPIVTGNPEWDQWEHHFAQVSDDIQLHYVDVGPRDAMPVVLIHGWPDMCSAPKETEAYGTLNVTSDLAKLLDFLNLPRAVFVGHDWGGAIVWRMCMYCPDRVLAVCGVCTPYFPQRDVCIDIDTLVKGIPQFSYMQFLSQSEMAAKVLDAAPRRVFTSTYRFPEEQMRDGKNVWYLEILKGVTDSDDPMYTQRSEMLSEQELEFYVQEYTRSGFRGSCNYYAVRALDFETEKALPRVIPHRALYIGAGKDPVLKPELAAHMPHVMPKLETALVKEGGHWLLWTQKDEVTEILLTWLGKLEQDAEVIAP
uniref:AB hydrolase-1 domain-containing protein n=1 Tax=Globisporangium ultimum (strain ATCC 200006 / CBS 805.95 / DAOM BR144) TaxID=431595 RepID=K3W994_GLOUD